MKVEKCCINSELLRDEKKLENAQKILSEILKVYEKDEKGKNYSCIIDNISFLSYVLFLVSQSNQKISYQDLIEEKIGVDFKYPKKIKKEAEKKKYEENEKKSFSRYKPWYMEVYGSDLNCIDFKAGLNFSEKVSEQFSEKTWNNLCNLITKYNAEDFLNVSKFISKMSDVNQSFVNNAVFKYLKIKSNEKICVARDYDAKISYDVLQTYPTSKIETPELYHTVGFIRTIFSEDRIKCLDEIDFDSCSNGCSVWCCDENCTNDYLYNFENSEKIAKKNFVYKYIFSIVSTDDSRLLLKNIHVDKEYQVWDDSGNQEIDRLSSYLGQLMDVSKLNGENIVKLYNWCYMFEDIIKLKNHITKKIVFNLTKDTLYKEVYSDLRRFLVENKLIEQIIEFPEYSIFILSENNDQVCFTKAYNSNFELTLNNKPKKIIISNQNILDSRSVLISNEYEQEDDLNFAEFNLLIKRATRGVSCRADEMREMYFNGNNHFKYLTYMDIKNGFIKVESLQSLNNISPRFERYCAENGDLIISKVAPFKISVIEIPRGYKVLVNENLYIIHLKEKFKDWNNYIKLFFLSRLGQKQLNKLLKEKKNQSIGINELKSFQIRFPVKNEKVDWDLINYFSDTKYSKICNKIFGLEAELQNAYDELSHLLD